MGRAGTGVRHRISCLGLDELPQPGRVKPPAAVHRGTRTGKKQKTPPCHLLYVDYADEHIVSFDELEPEERTFCSLATNLVLGSAMTLIGLAAGAL